MDAMDTDDLHTWLVQQEMGCLVDLDGESIYLKADAGGAELGALLLPAPTGEQIRLALQQGFSHALAYGAGLVYHADHAVGDSLRLSQWLPGIRSWQEAARPLENLLTQLTAWRVIFAPKASTLDVSLAPAAAFDRTEQRLRLLMTAGK
ncbi:hypothetical protein LT85_0496 [Collimonas arenae]|uniref:Uncharacterized protein n=2 Tax=Collimonas arenae TaxID=279058 RepID=A0A0A1F531_9BURK|nr:hypothetical protein LT85_0496 [Collimonas arenae]